MSPLGWPRVDSTHHTGAEESPVLRLVRTEQRRTETIIGDGNRALAVARGGNVRTGKRRLSSCGGAVMFYYR